MDFSAFIPVWGKPLSKQQRFSSCLLSAFA